MESTFVVEFLFSTIINSEKNTIPNKSNPRTLQLNILLKRFLVPILFIANITVNIEKDKKEIPIGTLIKKSQCHEPVMSIKKLPILGSMTEAIPFIPANKPSMVPCFSFLKELITWELAIIKIPPPPID